MNPHVRIRATRLAVAAGAMAFSLACTDGPVATAPALGNQPSLASGGGGGAGGGSVVKSMVGLEPLLDATQNFSFALKVSDLGQVIGTSAINHIGSIVEHAVIWDGSTFAQDLGTWAGGSASAARSILPNGSVIVGNSNSRAVRWVRLNGVWTIDALPDPEGSTSCQAMDIASDGTIVGTCSGSGSARVTIWRNGVATDLGPGAARAINRNGQILVAVAGGGLHAAIWDTRTNPITVTNLGSLGGPHTSALDINDLGDVVGSSTNAAVVFRPFLWTAKRGMVDLGTLVGGTGGQAEAINNAGQIVGSSFDGTLNHAVYWNRGKIFDLGVLPGYEDATAQGINATGQVVGYSMLAFEGTITDLRGTLWTLK